MGSVSRPGEGTDEHYGCARFDGADCKFLAAFHCYLKLRLEGGNYVAATPFDIFYTTTLGGAWTTVTPAFEPIPNETRSDVAFGNARFVTVMGGKLLRSNPVHGEFAP